VVIMSKVPRVLLFIESARGFGRSLLKGFSEYARFHGPWCIYTQVEIAPTMGYTSVDNLRRFFQRHMQMPPLEYQRECSA
jgi:AraC-like DNA-binding protein